MAGDPDVDLLPVRLMLGSTYMLCETASICESRSAIPQFLPSRRENAHRSCMEDGSRRGRCGQLDGLLGLTHLTFKQVVQFHAMMLAFQYTGAGPGSLLRTSGYPEEYAQWEVSLGKERTC